jgi:hypothetical protein
MSEKSLKKLRKIIAAWPETSEKLSHGAPTFWGGKKTFAVHHAGQYDEGREGVWIKAPEGAQEMLIESNPERFYRPKYVGPSGWVGVRYGNKPDWEELQFLLEQGYRLVAPKRALKILDAQGCLSTVMELPLLSMTEKGQAHSDAEAVGA